MKLKASPVLFVKMFFWLQKMLTIIPLLVGMKSACNHSDKLRRLDVVQIVRRSFIAGRERMLQHFLMLELMIDHRSWMWCAWSKKTWRLFDETNYLRNLFLPEDVQLPAETCWLIYCRSKASLTGSRRCVNTREKFGEKKVGPRTKSDNINLLLYYWKGISQKGRDSLKVQGK